MCTSPGSSPSFHQTFGSEGLQTQCRWRGEECSEDNTFPEPEPAFHPTNTHMYDTFSSVTLESPKMSSLFKNILTNTVKPVKHRLVSFSRFASMWSPHYYIVSSKVYCHPTEAHVSVGHLWVWQCTSPYTQVQDVHSSTSQWLLWLYRWPSYTHCAWASLE